MEPCSTPVSLLPRDSSKTADKTSHLPQTSLMENEGSTSPLTKKKKKHIYWDKALWWFEVICAESFWTRGVFKWENQMIGANFTCSLTRINHSFLMEVTEWSWIYNGKGRNQISLWPQKTVHFTHCNQKDWQRPIIFKTQREQFLMKKQY